MHFFVLSAHCATPAADEAPPVESQALIPAQRRQEGEFGMPEQQSREAEQELREYLQGNSRSASPVLRSPPAWLPVPTTNGALDPMDWDNEDAGSEGESLGVPTIVVRAAEDPATTSSRRRRKRTRPYNPRRHFEADDYVAAHLPTPPRSPSPPSAPIRRP